MILSSESLKYTDNVHATETTASPQISTLYTWNWNNDSNIQTELSPPNSCSSPEFSSRCEIRRGRPKAAVITNLMIEGSTSASAIKCRYCSRVFPREKSLQAHLRTHTGL